MRLTAPALSALLLAGAVALAIMHFGTLLGVSPRNPAAWQLPSAFGLAVISHSAGRSSSITRTLGGPGSPGGHGSKGGRRGSFPGREA